MWEKGSQGGEQAQGRGGVIRKCVHLQLTFNLGEWVVFPEAALIIHVDIDGTTGNATVVEGGSHHQVISSGSKWKIVNT